MNSTCRQAYNIFCEHNRGSHHESVQYLLDFMKIYTKKPSISTTEYELLGLYTYNCVGALELTKYEINLLLQGLAKLTVNYTLLNSQNMSFIFHSITKKIVIPH